MITQFDLKNHFFWGVVMVQAQYFETGTRYGLEILQQAVWQKGSN